MPLLHGILDVYAHEAQDLSTTYRIQVVGCLKRYVCCGMLPKLSGSCDPYLCLDVGSTRRLRTRFIQSTHNPRWDERFEVYVADEAEELKIQVKDADVVGADFLGQAIIPVSDIISGQLYDKWLELTDTNGKVMQGRDLGGGMSTSRVHITIRYRPVDSNGSVAASQDAPPTLYNEVPRAYFPMRSGNRVTLYHDSTCKPGPVEGVVLGNGQLYSESSCWDDLYHDILRAKRLIWITGWSVWTDTMLQRKPMSPQNSPTLGELLKTKAKQGVKVLLLVWDDTSNNWGLTPGVMATHDQETYEFFKGTEVTCVLCPRQGGTEDSYLQSAARGNMFSHHQKTVILDVPLHPAGQQHQQPQQPISPAHTLSRTSSLLHRPQEAPSRRLIAYVGGLDLCDGRYDTHDHSLFASTQPGGPHEKDYHQACIPGLNTSAPHPREPWHDIHSRVEGPIAVDVAINFMERWSKQAPLLHRQDLAHSVNWQSILLPEALRDFDSKRAHMKGMVRGHISLRVMAIKQQDKVLELKDTQPGESWNVQLFRSIDSDGADGFPKSTEGAFEAGLKVGKGKSIDASIQRAYIELIRNAKRYLYLENQYFLGSSHLWDTDTDTPCYNQVPAEIALKIVSKIRAGEPFRVYIVQPMFPEGIPTSGTVQAILYFQTKTRQMMYKRIAAAIAEAGIENAHPQDYLQFFCLGKRESNEEYWGSEAGEGGPTANGDAAASANGSRRVTAQDVELTIRRTSVAQASTRSPPGADSSVNGAAGDTTATDGAAAGAGATAQQRATAAKRHMIYVHSKMMIVDDEYIVVGSANINQRSLDGTRDSEICIGAFQPAHTLADNPHGPLPRGQVAGFRRVLFQEHLGALRPELEDPSSRDCMRALTLLGNENWRAYTDPAVNAPLPYGHLLTYPTWVDREGNVGPLEGCEEFPDLGGKIIGTKSGVLPPILTT